MAAEEDLELASVRRDSGESSARGTSRYDALISYSHADRRAAAAIQKGLHRVGRRTGQLVALLVFRDSTDLTASPDLWGRVRGAMDRPRLFIVVLSSHAVGYPVRDVATACQLVTPFVTRNRLSSYLPTGWVATCEYRS